MKIREVLSGAKNAFLNSEENMMSDAIRSEGEKRVPGVLRGLGCLGQALSILAGTFVFVRSGLASPAPENAAIQCAVGIGMIVFGTLPFLKRKK